MKTVYLVEDEQALCTLLEKYLTHEGYVVKTFVTGDEAMKHVAETPHLWILDINLPGYNGYQLIEAIKKIHSHIPVIFMSARNEELDRVIGLELGSEDYLPKPFLPRELVIRAKNLMERIYGREGVEPALERFETEVETVDIEIGYYTIKLQERVVMYGQEEIQLTTKEFDLLLYFVDHKNCVITREQILTGVWGDNYFGSDRVVDDTVRRLRKKLSESKLETIYGYGYKWVDKL